MRAFCRRVLMATGVVFFSSGVRGALPRAALPAGVAEAEGVGGAEMLDTLEAPLAALLGLAGVTAAAGFWPAVLGVVGAGLLWAGVAAVAVVAAAAEGVAGTEAAGG